MVGHRNLALRWRQDGETGAMTWKVRSEDSEEKYIGFQRMRRTVRICSQLRLLLGSQITSTNNNIRSTIQMATRLLQRLSPLPFAANTRHRVLASVTVRAFSARELIVPNSAIKAKAATCRLSTAVGRTSPRCDYASQSPTTGAWNIIRHTNGTYDAAWNPSLIPKYLQETYWWAYVHPLAIRFWDRHWLVNAILWGNYRHLRDQALMEIETCRCDKAAAAAAAASSTSAPSDAVNNPAELGLRVLHVSCVYNDFDTQLAQEHLSPPDTLHVVDVAPQQLENVQRKLSRVSSHTSSMLSPAQRRTVHLWQQDASNLSAFQDNSMDCVVLFFLLHEVPAAVRRAALAEAVRVVRPQTGRLVIVDYDRVSSRLNPFYYIMKLVLSTLEPFALDLWRTPLRRTLEEAAASSIRSPSSTISVVRHENFFGGMYQKLVVKKQSWVGHT